MNDSDNPYTVEQLEADQAKQQAEYEAAQRKKKEEGYYQRTLLEWKKQNRDPAELERNWSAIYKEGHSRRGV